MHREVSNCLLAGLPYQEWKLARGSLEHVKLQAGQTVEWTGVRLDRVYFLESGLISLIVPLASGASAEVAIVGHEGMLGVSLLLEADPPPYDMMCQIAGSALCMSSAAFVSLTNELPEFRRRLHRYTLALLNHISRTAACNGVHSVEQRLARWLLLCRDRVRDDDMPLTHEMLARMLSVGRPFVSQTVGTLHEAGLIEHTRRKIRITNSRGLEAVTCEDYRATEDQYESLLGWRPRGQ